MSIIYSKYKYLGFIPIRLIAPVSMCSGGPATSSHSSTQSVAVGDVKQMGTLEKYNSLNNILRMQIQLLILIAFFFYANNGFSDCATQQDIQAAQDKVNSDNTSITVFTGEIVAIAVALIAAGVFEQAELFPALRQALTAAKTGLALSKLALAIDQKALDSLNANPCCPSSWGSPMNGGGGSSGSGFTGGSSN